jgi:hypothetical protein
LQTERGVDIHDSWSVARETQGSNIVDGVHIVSDSPISSCEPYTPVVRGHKTGYKQIADQDHTIILNGQLALGRDPEHHCPEGPSHEIEHLG